MATKNVSGAPKVGRPTLYNPARIPEMIALFTEGASKTEIAAYVFHTTLVEFLRWEKSPEIPEFCNAVREGEALSLAFWEKKARTSCDSERLTGPNATMLIFNLKNRVNWTDRQAVQIDGDLTHVHKITALPDVELDAEITRLLDKQES